jgi:hypothetical protein
MKIGYIGNVKCKKILQMAILGYIFIYVQTEHYSDDADEVLGNSLSNLGPFGCY